MNKLLLTYILTIGICGVAGGGTGVILKRTIGPVDEHYPPGFDPREFSPNMEDIMARYNKLSIKTIDSMSTGFTDSDIINISLENYRNQEYCWCVASGNANTIVTQTIRNSQIKNGDEYFEEQLSYSSVVSLAKRSLQHGKDGQIDVFDGSCSGPESAAYGASPTGTFEKSAYKDILGKTLDEMFIYIISEKTVLSSSKKKSGTDYIINLDLNPNLSTYYYKTQMKNISGLSNLPPFSEVKLTFTVANDLTLKHLLVDETYVATKEGIPVPATTHNIINNYYHAGDPMDIPSSGENIDYGALLAREEN